MRETNQQCYNTRTLTHFNEKMRTNKLNNFFLLSALSSFIQTEVINLLIIQIRFESTNNNSRLQSEN